MPPEDKTKEEQEFEDDVKAHAEETGQAVEDVSSTFCHCCGHKVPRTLFGEMFGQSEICKCALSKHCYRCGYCHIHCQCEEDPTESAKAWLIEKHGKTERRNIGDLLIGGKEFESLVDYAEAYMDLVRSEQYDTEKVLLFHHDAFDALLGFVYGKDIFKEISRLLDGQKGR